MILTSADYSTIWPLIFLTVWASVLLLVDLFIPKERKGITALLSAVGLALTLSFTLLQIGQGITGFSGMVVLDGFSVFVGLVVAVLLASAAANEIGMDNVFEDVDGALEHARQLGETRT